MTDEPLIVWVAGEALRSLTVEASRSYPLETGGLLMGYTVPSKLAIVVVSIVGPGPCAKHLRARFIPDYKYHELEVARSHAASGGETRYLGDWHSHPDGAPFLSAKDLGTLRTIATSLEAAQPTPTMVLAAGRPEQWEFKAFRGSLKKGVLWRKDLRVEEAPIRTFEGEM